MDKLNQSDNLDLKQIVADYLQSADGQKYLDKNKEGQPPPPNIDNLGGKVNTFRSNRKGNPNSWQQQKNDYVADKVLSRRKDFETANGAGSRGYAELMKRVQGKDAQFIKYLTDMKNDEKPFKQVGHKRLGVTYDEEQEDLSQYHQALVEICARKLGQPGHPVYPNKVLAQKLCDEFGVKIGNYDDVQQQRADLTYQQWEELVALDDFGTIASAIAVPLLREHGPKAIRWVWDKVLGNKYTGARDSILDFISPYTNQKEQRMPQDGRSNIEQYQSALQTKLAQMNINNHQPALSGIPNMVPGLSGDITKPMSSVTLTGVNTKAQSYNHDTTTAKELSFNTVNVDYVRTYLCPERYAYRKPTNQPAKTAVSMGCVKVPIITDPSGNAMAYIYPQQALASGAGSSNTFALTITPGNAGFVPSTGVYPGIITQSLAGPLFASAASVESFRLSAASIQVIPTVGTLNTAGAIDICYFQQPLNSTFTTLLSAVYMAPQLPLSQVLTQPFYQGGNMLTTYRSIHIPCDNDQDTFGNPPMPPVEEGWYIVITGASASQQVAEVLVFYTYEFQPTSGSASICAVDYAKGGYATDAFITNMMRMIPACQSYNLQEVARMLTAIDGLCFEDHDKLLQILASQAKTLTI